MWNMRLQAIALAAVILLVTGCAARVTSEVTRFHREQAPQSGTIAIVPMDERKRGGIEFARYAARIADKLAMLGYTVVEEGEPSLYARLDYAVGDAQTRVRSLPRNFVHYHFWFERYHPYYYGRYWDEPRIYSETVYPRTVDLTIVQADGRVVFEGHVKSLGREDNMNRVFPYLAEAMFQNFPGESGVTKIVTIREEERDLPY